MWLYVTEYAVGTLLVYLLLRWAYRNWNRSPILDKQEQLETLNEDYNTVEQSTKKFKDIKEKRNAINEFKKL